MVIEVAKAKAIALPSPSRRPLFGPKRNGPAREMMPMEAMAMPSICIGPWVSPTISHAPTATITGEEPRAMG